MTSQRFSDIVGADHVRPGEPTDAVRGVVPGVVVEPASAGELASVLGAANEQGVAVSPVGGGTKVEWGNPPSQVDVALSTKRLDKVVEHAWSDLTVTVEAGCTVGALQAILGQRRQRVAIDPLWPDRATVGGVLSTNDTGALRLRFGGLRDLIIGVTLALPDGTLATSGGKVVKNVAGYDLPKLVTGAFGTLGVITGAIFRVHPIPQQSASFSVETSDLAGIQQLFDALQDSKLAHSSLQARASIGARPRIDIRFEGNAAGIAAGLDQANRLCPESEFALASADVWSAKQDLWSSDGQDPIAKISVLPSRIARTVHAIENLAGPPDCGWDVVFQATGIGWVRLRSGRAPAASIVAELRSAVERDGGSLVVLRAANTCDAWGRVPDAIRLMKNVKQQFDSNRTLNPGRFVGGI